MDSYTNQTNSYDRWDSTGGPSDEALKAAAYRQVQAAYKQYLDRDASPSELEAHLGGRYDSTTVKRVVDAIRTSPEAQQAATRIAEGRRTSTSTGTTGSGGSGGSGGGGGGNFTSRDERDKLTWSGAGRMEGFEVGSTYGGDLKARNSVKNTFGRIASRYPATPDGLKQVVNDPDFRKAFPNARIVDHPTGDKIDFGGIPSDFESGTPVGVVDVGRAFRGAEQGDEQTAWVWQPEGGSSQQSSTPPPQNQDRDQGAPPASGAPPPEDMTPPPATQFAGRESYGTEATRATSPRDTSEAAYQSVQNAILELPDFSMDRSPNVQDAVLGGGGMALDGPLGDYIRYMNWVRSQRGL